MFDPETETDVDVLQEYARISTRENRLLRRRLTLAIDRLADATGQDHQQLLAAETELLEQKLEDEGLSRGLASTSERDPTGAPADDVGGNEPKDRTEWGTTEQTELDVEEEVHELDDADKTCPECGGRLEPIDGQFEESEEIDVIEVRYKLIHKKRQKYRCSCSDCQHIDTALGPEEPKPRPRGRYRLGFCVHSILDKYQGHLPLSRQTKLMARAGLKIRSSTLWDQHWACARHLEPAWEALRQLQMDQDVVGADETRWRLMSGKKVKPQIFALTSEQAVYYTIQRNKKKETVDRLLAGFSGRLVVDGLSTYTAVCDDRRAGFEASPRDGPEPFSIAGCWAHARRYFVKAYKSWPEAARMIWLIAALYRIVGGAEEHDVAEEVRCAWIDAVLEQMRDWMLEQAPNPNTALRDAIRYLDNHWDRLTVFRDHPEVWLDNNASERALRTAVVGRKNHYGSKSKAGMKAAAIFYSLIETCELIGVNPRDYLREALTRAIRQPGTAYLPHEMLPDDATV